VNKRNLQIFCDSNITEYGCDNTGDVVGQYWISDKQKVVTGVDKLGRSKWEAVIQLSDSADELSGDDVDH